MKKRYIVVLAVLVVILAFIGLVIASDFALLLLFININNDLDGITEPSTSFLDRFPVERPFSVVGNRAMCMHGDFQGGASWSCQTELYGTCVYTENFGQMLPTVVKCQR